MVVLSKAKLCCIININHNYFMYCTKTQETKIFILSAASSLFHHYPTGNLPLFEPLPQVPDAYGYVLGLLTSSP